MNPMDLVVNAAGREVPAVVNGREQVPYQGAGQHLPSGFRQAPPVRSSAGYPANGDKRVANLETALRQCGLRDGMVISNHHHLRDGDRIAVEVLQTAARLGAKDLMWFPSASFPAQKGVSAHPTTDGRSR